jgi:hypothetical protein
MEEEFGRIMPSGDGPKIIRIQENELTASKG